MNILDPAAICVPIRNEARNLPGLFRAIAALSGRTDAPTILALLFDGCTDGSRALAETLASQHAGLTVRMAEIPGQDLPHAGRARAAALALGLDAIGGEGLLLTTDADTRPAADWLAATRRALAAADMVCGRVDRLKAGTEPWRVAMEGYLLRLHAVRRTIDPVPHDPLPSHPHMGGASLALHAAIYRAVGGLPDLASGEDRALVLAVRRAGYQVRHDPLVRVRTSGRMRGRATGGLADALRDGRKAAATGIAALVEHPDDAVVRYRAQAVARAAWRASFHPAPSADAHVLATVPDRPGESRAVPLAAAAHLLAAHETSVESSAA
jgi:hypothetical protein